jgi:hypothetical protein
VPAAVQPVALPRRFGPPAPRLRVFHQEIAMAKHIKRAAVGLLIGPLLSAPSWAGDPPKAFSMGLEAREHATLAELGLPDYPGATPYSEGHGDKPAATAGAWFGAFGLRVSAMKFQAADSPARVASFYVQALGRHGTVLDCRDPAQRVKPPQDDKSDRLTCDESAPPAGQYEFRVGTRKQFRVVVVKPHGDGGARFEIVRIALG